MRRRQWLFVALPLVLLTVVLFSVRSLGGSTNVALANVNTGTAHIEIDLVKDGSTWCNPVNTTNTVPVSATPYQVAICLSDDDDASPAAFQFNLVYNNALDSCSDVAGSALDANPDANTGSTTFSSPDLGTGWDCNIQSVAPPTCAKGGTAGTAFLKCQTVTGTSTLPFGAGVSAPLAVVNLTAIASGVDNLAIQSAAVFDPDGLGIISSCNASTCKGATETKQGGPTPLPATATPTNTPQPTAANTPSCGLVGQAACPTSTATERPFTRTPSPAPTNTPGAGVPTVPPPPPPAPPSGGQQPSVAPPNTGTGPGGVTWATTLMWILGSGAALSLLAGGFYLHRVNNR